MDFRADEVARPVKSAVFIPTNLPRPDDPRDFSKRALARFRVGMELARNLREEHGRANVIVVVFGGWPLYNRLPLSIQHVYAAARLHNLLELEELDFVASYGINTVTDLHGTLAWMKENILNVRDAYVVTSKGHAARIIAESGMHSLFTDVYHIESHEPRDSDREDENWSERARSIPPHQYRMAARASEVSRFGSLDSLEWIHRTTEWALENPEVFETYLRDIWRLVGELEENSVAIRSRTPGAWRLNVNC